MKITRRKMMIGAAAMSVTASAGGISLLAMTDLKDQLLAYFQKALPDIKIDEASAHQCVEDFLIWREWSITKRLVANVAWGLAGVDTMAALNRNFELAARRALTLFLANSNFFYLDDPRSELIVYESKPPGTACTNPFANLSPPETKSHIAQSSQLFDLSR